MRVLGVDWGGARIGLAVGESEFRIATPRPPLRATGTLANDAELISRVAKSEEVERLVVGVPFHEEDSRAARICLTLAERLRDRGWLVETVDESLTTSASHEDLIAAGVSASERKRVIDGESARRILLRWFEERHD